MHGDCALVNCVMVCVFEAALNISHAGSSSVHLMHCIESTHTSWPSVVCLKLYVDMWQVTGLKSSTSGSLAAFERMEQKVVAMEAEADAVGQV